VPQDIPVVDIAVPAVGIRIGALLKAAGLAPSTSEAVRKLGERAVRVDGAVVDDRELTLQVGAEHLLQLGKRGYARVRLISG
jgi:tyrosyl-tRNA synthetase